MASKSKGKSVTRHAVKPPALTEAEGADLARLEAVVEAGLKSFMEVGGALAEIGRRRLYRVTHATFEAYCRERWGMGKSYAGKQIRAAKVVAALGEGADSGTIVPTLPMKEGVARPLTKLKEPGARRKAWHRAVKVAHRAGREEPQAADVERAVAEAKGSGLVLNGSGKIDKLASLRAAREAQATAPATATVRHGDTSRVRHLREALAHLQAAARADNDRWAAPINAEAARVETLLGHVLTKDRR